jgi:hypothetical protein
MKRGKLTQLGWVDAADYFREQGKKYGTTKFTVPAVVQLPPNDDALAPPPVPFGKLMQSLDIVAGILQRLEGTSPTGTRHIRLCSVKLQSESSIPRCEPTAEPDLSTLLKAKPVQPVCLCLGI